MNKKFKSIINNKILNYYQLNKFYSKSSKQLSFIKKVVVTFNQKSVDFKQITSSHLALEMLFWQKSISTKINSPNILYKTKTGQPVGCKITENHKTKNLELAKFILKILTAPEKKNNLKCNNIKKNHLTHNILDIYNTKKLENYYSLFYKLNKLNISFLLTSYNKHSNRNSFFISFFSKYNSTGRV